MSHHLPGEPTVSPAPCDRPLTPTQLAVLTFICEQLHARGYAPTIRETMVRFGWSSTNACTEFLVRLEAKGCITRGHMTSRSTRVTDRGYHLAGFGAAAPGHQGAEPSGDIATIPVVDRIEPGAPLLTWPIDTIRLGRGDIDLGARLALRMGTDAMANAGINPGDYVIIRPQQSAKHGQVVVVLLGDLAIVRRYHEGPGVICLRAENPRLSPMYVRQADWSPSLLVGVMVGLVRKLHPASVEAEAEARAVAP